MTIYLCVIIGIVFAGFGCIIYLIRKQNQMICYMKDASDFIASTQLDFERRDRQRWINELLKMKSDLINKEKFEEVERISVCISKEIAELNNLFEEQ